MHNNKTAIYNIYKRRYNDFLANWRSDNMKQALPGKARKYNHLGHTKLISWFSGPPACGNSSPHCRFYCKNSKKKM